MQNEFMQTITNSMTPKFAVSYLRVSSRGQAERGGGDDEGFSIPAQREANKKKAHAMGAIIGKEFVDRGASARSADRPELKEMLEYIKDNSDRVDYVIVHKVDRLARNRGDDVDISRALREANVQLVSASESIDETPAGMLLHGIMSSIAEFYSQNLATEVKKGMDGKGMNGGTICKAPLGYVNVRKTDELGREYRTVELDEGRAPLIKRAFEEYATGQWTVCALAEQLAAQGLTTRPTPRIPSAQIDRGALNKILVNPYYKGTVVYKGVEYDGNHEPLVDKEIWQAVQDILKSRINGERTREHPHFLKGSLFCRKCGSRMIVTHSKSRSGVIYPYYVCSGRHSKREDCDQKSVLIEEVERRVEEMYEHYSLDPQVRTLLEEAMIESIKRSEQQFEIEKVSLLREKSKLEQKRRKLLEAHYDDAIPLELLKSEQMQITGSLALIEQKLRIHSTEHELVVGDLQKALDSIEDCGRTYRLADSHIKRLINQAICEKIWVESGGKVSTELNELFKVVLQPIEDSVVAYNVARLEGRYSLADFLKKASNHISNFFGCGLNMRQVVYPKGIEPSNLTDANRALSQLSYGPLFLRIVSSLTRKQSWSIRNTLDYSIDYFYILAIINRPHLRLRLHPRHHRRSQSRALRRRRCKSPNRSINLLPLPQSLRRISGTRFQGKNHRRRKTRNHNRPRRHPHRHHRQSRKNRSHHHRHHFHRRIETLQCLPSRQTECQAPRRYQARFRSVPQSLQPLPKAYQ